MSQTDFPHSSKPSNRSHAHQMGCRARLHRTYLAPQTHLAAHSLIPIYSCSTACSKSATSRSARPSATSSPSASAAPASVSTLSPSWTRRRSALPNDMLTHSSCRVHRKGRRESPVHVEEEERRRHHEHDRHTRQESRYYTQEGHPTRQSRSRQAQEDSYASFCV